MGLQIIVPTRIQDQIWDAVRDAISAGMEIRDFLREVEGDWMTCLDDDKKAAAEEFARRLHR